MIMLCFSSGAALLSASNESAIKKCGFLLKKLPSAMDHILDDNSHYGGICSSIAFTGDKHVHNRVDDRFPMLIDNALMHRDQPCRFAPFRQLLHF